jgi:hypothetical protein
MENSSNFYERPSSKEINNNIYELFQNFEDATGKKRLDLYDELVKYMRDNYGYFLYDEKVYSLFSDSSFLHKTYDWLCTYDEEDLK